MKKTKYIIILLLILFLGLQGQEKAKTKPDNNPINDFRAIYEAYRAKNFTKALELTETTMKKQGWTMDLMHWKYNILIQLKRLDDALNFIDVAIKKTGESEQLVSARYNTFMLMNKLQDALEAAKHKDKIAKENSPWDCLNIMHVYLRMKKKEEAMDWLQEAANRGFLSYRILIDKKYQILNKEKRFYDIVEMIKVNVGLGNKARNFQVTLLSGELFNLWRQKGKVTVVMFWATWCNPCRRDMKFMKDTYARYKDKNVEMIAISLDTDEKIYKDYIKKQELTWKHSFTGKGWQDPTVIRYGLNTIPSYWLVDKKGVLRSFDLKGPDLNTAISELLAE
jgi:thiol-disulfide isomerase/thioredoxin